MKECAYCPGELIYIGDGLETLTGTFQNLPPDRREACVRVSSFAFESYKCKLNKNDRKVRHGSRHDSINPLVSTSSLDSTSRTSSTHSSTHPSTNSLEKSVNSISTSRMSSTSPSTSSLDKTLHSISSQVGSVFSTVAVFYGKNWLSSANAMECPDYGQENEIKEAELRLRNAWKRVMGPLMRDVGIDENVDMSDFPIATDTHTSFCESACTHVFRRPLHHPSSTAAFQDATQDCLDWCSLYMTNRAMVCDPAVWITHLQEFGGRFGHEITCGRDTSTLDDETFCQESCEEACPDVRRRLSNTRRPSCDRDICKQRCLNLIFRDPRRRSKRHVQAQHRMCNEHVWKSIVGVCQYPVHICNHPEKHRTDLEFCLQSCKIEESDLVLENELSTNKEQAVRHDCLLHCISYMTRRTLRISSVKCENAIQIDHKKIALYHILSLSLSRTLITLKHRYGDL